MKNLNLLSEEDNLLSRYNFSWFNLHIDKTKNHNNILSYIN